ncbi:MAG: transposase [Alphaproteobacteria bacterium]|nr:transposase [Alphaproteobacteria bacterium]OJV47128.1 MAG: hypothetical protein BGO28_01640 [Alphaproteobacteria bacterium 43-37]
MIRRKHSKDFKFKVALETIRGDLTIAQIVSKYGVAESLVHKWRKQLLDYGAQAFEEKGSGKAESMSESDLQKLHAKIGQLTLENDFF